MPRTVTPARERFEAHVDRTGGPDACHPWTGGIFRDTGYGVFHPVKGKTATAHRWLFIEENGDPGADVHVDHECHNTDPDCPGGRECPHRRCVNPAHLVGKSPRENGNASPRSNAVKTHCPRQHPYSEENTRIHTTKVGSGRGRSCLECARERERGVYTCGGCGQERSVANKARHEKKCEKRTRESE